MIIKSPSAGVKFGLIATAGAAHIETVLDSTYVRPRWESRRRSTRKRCDPAYGVSPL